MKLTGIYCIRNTNNGKSYVGQSINIQKRIQSHQSGRGGTGVLDKSIKKNGINAFVYEIYELCEPSNLDAREQHWIASLDSVSPNGYNLTPGGEGGSSSKETRQKISQANKGRVPWNKGKETPPEIRRKQSLAARNRSPEAQQAIAEANRKPRSKEVLKRMSDSRKGRTAWNKGKKMPPISAETRKKMSASRRGKKMPPRTPEHCAKISKANKGRVIKPETRKKISESIKGITRSPETRARMSEAAKRRKSKRRNNPAQLLLIFTETHND